MGRMDEYRTDEEERGEGGAHNLHSERYRTGEVVDLGDGLRATVIDASEAEGKIKKMGAGGKIIGLFETAPHQAARTMAWRYFCDNCGRDRNEPWFNGEFRALAYWGTAENGALQNVAFTFNVAPATEGISRVTVCGNVNDLSVALARADYRHYNGPAIKELPYDG